MQHQNGCPLAYAAAYELSSAQGISSYNPRLDETENDKTCPDRRCSTWLDLHSWFGYTPRSLNSEEFTTCFVDIGHGGKGIYERLIILGEKSLESMGRIYISEKFTDFMMPFDLQRGIPTELLKLIWTMKRVERILSVRALSIFGKTYLSTAQSLPSPTVVGKYIRACVGFAVQCQAQLRAPTSSGYRLECLAAAEKGIETCNTLIYDWASILIDNIYYTQKLKTEATAVEDELIQDMQDYFGYPYDTVIPRVRNIIAPSIVSDDVNGQAQTGRDIIQLVATEYFMAMARQSKLDPTVLSAWLEDELKYFMNSKAMAIFAVTHFNLKPILEEIYYSRTTTPNSDMYETVFMQLLAASYSVTRESQTKKYMPALMCRLRQIQVLIHMKETDITMYGRTAFAPAQFQGVDINRWSSISSWAHPINSSWLRDPRSEHMDAFLPTSSNSMRRLIRALENRNSAKGSDNSLPSVIPVGSKCRTVLTTPSQMLTDQPHQGYLAPTDNNVRIPICNGDGTVAARLVTNKRKHTVMPKIKEIDRRRPADILAQNLAEQTNGTLYKPPFAPLMAPRVIPNPADYGVKIHGVDVPFRQTSSGCLAADWSENGDYSDCSCEDSDSGTSMSNESEVHRLVRKMKEEQEKLMSSPEYRKNILGKYVNGESSQAATVELYRRKLQEEDERLYGDKFYEGYGKKHTEING